MASLSISSSENTSNSADMSHTGSPDSTCTEQYINLPVSEGESVTGGQQTRASSKLYIGNMDPDVTEDILKDFFTEKGINLNHLVRLDLKGTYGFVEFSDQSTADKAIDQCHRKSLLSTIIKVEPSVRMDRIRPQRRHPTTQRKVSTPTTSTSGYDLPHGINCE